MGTLFGLVAMALVVAVAARRRFLDDVLGKAYGPIHVLLGENVAARARLAKMEEKLMATYASESAPFTTEQKKAAAEAFLTVERQIMEEVVYANRERMKNVIAEWGHLLDDDDYLALAEELAGAVVVRVLHDADLPPELREPPPANYEAELLEQFKMKYLGRSGERRAGFLGSLAGGLKHMFAAR